MTQYMPLFKACTKLKSLTQLHAHLIVTGLHRDVLASTKLIEAYSQTGSMQPSTLLFDSFPNPDSFMWGVMIKCNVWNGLFREAIYVYQRMLDSWVKLNHFIFPSVLRACSGMNDLRTGEKVHGRILKSGCESDPVIETSLLSVYGELGCLSSARKVFDEMPIRDSVSWSSIMSNHVRNGEASEGLEIFREMVSEGVEIDSVTMLSVVEACGELGLWRFGKSCHSFVVRRDLGSDREALWSSLVAMYGKFGDLYSADKLFFCSEFRRGVIQWTALMSCYNQNGYYLEALWTFVQMLQSGVDGNHVSFMNAVCSCARLGWLREGKSVHGYVLRNNIELDKDFLRSSVIDLYASCGNLAYACRVFDTAQYKHLVLWNILISGCVREHKAEKALSLFVGMLVQGILPDSFSLAPALSACGMIELSEMGCQIHCLIIKSYLPDEFVENALIDMYSKCGFINSAFKIFCDVQRESVVAWNSMMCGFSQNGCSNEALTLFDEMYATYRDMDEVTFLSAVQACSNLGYIDKGRWIHHKLITFGVDKDMYVDTALVNMYARCGDLHMARRVFDTMTGWSVVSWSSMIGGYAMHGYVDDSILLVDRMVELGIKPNEITFMNILSACSHAGYVEKGKFYFNSMVRDFGISPSSEHYGVLVDLLSRGGDLSGAYEVISSMPFPADASIWGALVNGCRIHRRMDFLDSIKQDVLEMDSDDSGFYTLLSNVYQEEGKWDDSSMVKARMRNLAVKKVHGYSMIEIDPHLYSS
ncbi:putative pentatricopeptide repeat-containing protein At1g69350, mitochondrial [Salvia hispanica]|uniref:putative pentatricopeptide repeat-containing protein At1g69350, mitochondrial n=1 Tax=Salvia hispanica TaxID=49212 RepID=UPI002009BC79|nr:putative pentatricopeptide repeat-containing protein At1g69350, mitochondrial [Salvia hispanica]